MFNDIPIGKVYIKNIKHNEHIYVGEPKLDEKRRHVLTPRNNTSCDNNDMKLIIHNYGDCFGI